MSMKKALGAVKRVASKVASKVKSAAKKVHSTLPTGVKRLTTSRGRKILGGQVKEVVTGQPRKKPHTPLINKALESARKRKKK